ncbi:hypothetical protein BJY04DRAFT_227620 [Aspergillus karnatakaensis]|uniref:uncharacterized protein n=1 Tax=Aspergillus karnatakaensis TaxID=1810916 RepID=UPI003CCE2656
MAKTISPETWMLLVGVLGLLAVVACSFSALQEVFGRVTKRTGSIRLEDDTSIEEQQGLRYEDEDGEATEQTLKEFQDAQRWQRWAIVGASVVGFGVGLAQAVVVSVTGGRDGRRFIVTSWMLVACWMVLSLQPISLFTEPSSVKRYNHGIKMFWESILSIVVTLTQLSISWTAGYKIRVNAAFSTLLAAQITIASLRAILSILIPRRPNVYFEGQVVDQEYSATAYNRFTYGWATTLLKFASKNKGLGIDDLPKLPYTARAETVHARLEKFQAGRKLWVALVMRHRRALVVQGLLSLVVCIIGFGPQVAMYKILKVLEDRSVLSMDSTAAWVWVGALGVLLAMSSSIESWLWWLIYSDLWVPIYAGLSGLVFAKSMRCKDVKSVKSKTMHEDDWESEDEEEGEEQERNRQSIINLAAVDSKRIADFVTFSYLIPSCVIRLAIATVFLARLIGWPSLLAGIGGAVLLTPFNSWLTKRYALAQEELMKASDKRTSAVTEVLQGIRQVKFGALEQQWEDRISEKREAELSLLWKTSVYTTGMVSVWIMGPLLLSAISLTVYAYTRGELSPSVAFTALSIFGSLESSLAGLPDLISKAMEAKVSADRIDTYLASAEKVSNFADVDCITFSDATVAWPSDENEQDNLNPWESDSFTLTNLNLKFPPKGLSVIVGKTGSGKSLLLASILGECDVLQGSIKVPRSLPASQRFDHLAHRGNWILDTAIAYVAQNPWMENASIKENILFGLPYDRTRYRETLFASGLEKDMTILPDGDLTDIGANGINLSGGQRWRVSFARALYSRAGILILDDIFSALDAETGRHAYEHALTGKLGQGRTRILVTHHVGLCLPRTDYCVLLEDGGVSHAGTVEELQASGGLSEIQGPAEVNRDEQPVVTQELPKRKRSSAASAGRRSSVFSMKTIKKFMQEEERETGSISLKVYTTYLNKGNGLGWWILAFLCYAAFMALLVGRSWWVSVWTSSSQNNHHHPTHPTAITHQAISLSTINTTQNTHHDLTYYLTIYIAISALACLLGTLRCLALALAFIHSSRRLFTDLLSTILRAPLRWLDTVPLGRILNRFTSDIYLLDWRLGYDIGHLVYKILELAGILVAGVSVSPLLLLLALALLTLCARLCSDYLSGVRELKRLESLSKSPYLEKFSTSLSGLSTLRAFQKSTLYITEMHKLITRHATASWYLWLFNRWLGFWMALVGALFSLLTAGLVVSMPGISAALAGFAMSFALQYNYAVAMGLRFYANVEIDMNATERILEYTNIETESKEGYKPPPSWPARGSIEVEDLTVAYDTDLPPVLKNVSFKIENNTRVGVVGRTGAGKSSLTLALFRFLEAQTGRILIDGIDISVLDLTELRGRLAIIPQDPVLFSGTVRSNLDPFGEFSEEELYHALRRVHLVPSSSSLDSVNGTRGGRREGERDEEMSGSSTLASPSSSRQPSNLNLPFHIPPPKPINHSSTPTITLSTAISPAGTNLSHGQRQLLSLARALLRHPPILILDEATSAVDTATDALIQSSIRSEFGRENSSLLVIAHRLSTIADFDRILVLDEGRVVEWGAPRELMGIEGGVFRNLVQKSGEKSVVEGIIFGGGKCKDV